MPQIGEITTLIKRAASEAGFDQAGIAPVRDFPELTHYPAWIAAGRAGEMNYLAARNAQGDLKRASLCNTVPWARSVIVCAINYNTAQPYSTQVRDRDRGWVSRYAWGREDYHQAVMRRLRQVEARLRAASANACQYEAPPPETPAPAPSPGSRHSLKTRCYVDTGPLVERVYAKYAGVGWTGKNTCILSQQLGSWLFLGVILTSLELEPDLPTSDRCGTCTRCIEACPTQAFIAPYQLDSNRCISYLTIEKRGTIPAELRAGMGRHVFGCDICQDVCPWNRKSLPGMADEFEPRPELVNPALEWLAELTAEDFRRLFRGSPVRRTKLSGLRRNAVIAMGNSGNRKFLQALEKLQTDPDEVVAESANWATRRLLAVQE
jgi:epoxyqueuosine reductase